MGAAASSEVTQVAAAADSQDPVSVAIGHLNRPGFIGGSGA
jgi:hypothetical protein